MFGKMMEGNFDFTTEGDNLTKKIEQLVESQSKIVGENSATFAKFLEQYGAKMPEQLREKIEGITGIEIKPQGPAGVETGEVPPAGTTPKADATLQGGESKMDININVTAPPGMSQQQIMDALNIQEIKEKIYKIYEDMSKDFKKK